MQTVTFTIDQQHAEALQCFLNATGAELAPAPIAPPVVASSATGAHSIDTTQEYKNSPPWHSAGADSAAELAEFSAFLAKYRQRRGSMRRARLASAVRLFRDALAELWGVFYV